MAKSGTGGGGGGAFITQKGEKISEVKKEIADLEKLLAGTSQTSQSTLLLKKRKEMKEVDEALELMKDDYKRRMDECEERRLQFELKQARLREQVLKFEKFIQENDAKRLRAEVKAKQERKLYEDKCRELQALLNKISDLEADQRALQADLDNKRCFRDFLDRIVEETDMGYEEIGDILNRHRTLVDANRDLMRHARGKEAEVDELTYRLQALKTEQQNHLLVSNSYVQGLQKQLETLRSRVKEETSENYHLEDKQKNVSRELSQVALGIRNIFSRCVATMENTKLSSFGSGAVSVGAAMASVSSGTFSKPILDYNIDVMGTRMIDLLDITREYKESFSLTGTMGGGSGAHQFDLKEGSMMSMPTTPTTVN